MTEVTEVASRSGQSPPLWLRRSEDVVLTPAREVSDTPAGFACAGYTRTGKLVDDFTFRRQMHDAPPAAFERPRKIVADPHLYGGVLLGHYGHFLLESLSRLWAARAFPHLPVVWQFFPRAKHLFATQVFDILGIPAHRIRTVVRPTLFRTLIAPDEGVRLNTFFHPDQIAALATYPFRDPVKSKQVWLSRRRLVHGTGRVLDEDAIEDRLTRPGWTIISPEKLSVREQLEVMADAETLGGFIGSAFHTPVLGRDVRAKLRMLRRYNEAIPETFDILAAIKGFDQRIIDIKLEVMNQTENAALAVSRMANPREIGRIIDELHG